MSHFVQEVEHSKTVYEIQVDSGPNHADVTVSPDGKIQTEERTISIDEIPAAVRSQFAKSRFRKGKIVRAEQVTRTSASIATYELVVALSGAKYELAYKENGRPISEERVRDED